MPYGPDRFDDSMIYSDGDPTTLLERLGYVKQLVLSRTKLEFKLLWNKIFQKDDDELGWLLNPYRQSARNEATMMKSFNKNTDDSYQWYGYDDVGNVLGREKVTIYNRGVVRKADCKKKNEERKSFKDSALELARNMGMGVYMTSTSFPSPFFPVNDHNLTYDESIYGPQNLYSMSKLW